MAADRAMFASLVLICRRGTCRMMRRNGVSAVGLPRVAALNFSTVSHLTSTVIHLGMVLSENLVNALANRGVRLRPLRASEVKRLQPLSRPLDSLVAIALIALLLLARSVPVERKPLPQVIGADGAFDDIERLLIAVCTLAQDLFPAHVAGKDGLAERRNFRTGLGNDGDKEPALAIDRAQVLLRAQLAVSDVNEARMLQQGADATPRLQMDPIVGLVAVVGLEVHRHGAVAGYAKTIDQLLEIGTALFAVPSLELNGLGILTVVGSAHHDARGIVVDLLHLESEAVHNRQYDARLQGGPIRCKQPIKSPSELVVADLALPNQSRIVKCRPFPNGIERVALDQDVLDQRQQRFGVARVLQRQGQLVREPHASDDAVQNR